MKKSVWQVVDGRVFAISGILCLIFLIWAVLAPASTEAVCSWLLSTFSSNFGWLYLLAVAFFIVFLVYMAVGRYGRVRLGRDDEKPAYSTASWFFMLFAAGMGIGLVFWSAAEPMSHFLNPPMGQGGTAAAATEAMRHTFTHWGIHPWACYGIIGLPLAYFQFRKGQPALLSSCLAPLLGDGRIRAVVGTAVDVLAIFATIFGVATSLGLGVMQINSGLHYVFGLPYNDVVMYGIIAVTTAIFVTSSVSGINKGIKRLSDLNIVLMAILLLFIFFAGATLFVTNFFVDSVGQYLSHIISASFWTDPFSESNGWLNGWTIFYWAWWIAWAPFVGGFIARISRGRTIRQFVVGTMLCPVLLCFVFMAVMGGNAIHLHLEGVTAIAEATGENVTYALFALLEQFPLSPLISLLTVVVILIFFITSADSATYICATMTSRGVQDPPPQLKLFWGLTEGAVAAMLLAAGGLTALQSASILAAFPLMFVCVLLAFSLLKTLKTEAPQTP